jgi:DNA polymerase-1
MISDKKQLILIDGNALLHRAFHAYPVLNTSKGEMVNAVYGFATMLLQVLDRFNPEYIVVTFDKKGPTFRHQEFTQYKAQRKPMDDTLASQIERTYELVQAFNIPIFAITGYEADDLIGTITRKVAGSEGAVDSGQLVDEVIIVTGDRDLLQLLSDNVKAFMPGKSFSEGSIVDVAGFQEKYGLEKPLQLIDFKALRGDASDNIPGVSGIGDVGATKLIKKFDSIENLYAHLNEVDEKTRNKLVESAEMAALSKKLATIDTNAPLQFDLSLCRTEDYDKQKVIELFEQLEFKSLVKRMQGKVGGEKKDEREKTKEASVDIKRKDEREKKKEIKANSAQEGLPFDENEDTEKSVAIDKAENPKEYLREFLKDQPEEIIKLDLTMIDVLERMKAHGILVAPDVLAELSVDFGKKLDKVTKDIHLDAGHEFNINSPKQLAEILFDNMKLPVLKHTKTGRSTNEEVLTELAISNPFAEKILEYRELYKLKSTYIDALPNYIEKDGRIHSTFHLDIAATGRLSSKDPNLQNIPIKGQWGMAIRKAFVAPAGSVLLACDYSQIELRILAHLSGDEGMRKIFSEGKDIHASTAALVFNIAQDQVSKDQRRSAKAINFGLMYGMGPHALSRDLKITYSQAQLFIKAYFEAFPKVKEWIEGVLQKGREVGYVETMLGRRRYLPELQSVDKRLKSAGERMAINMPAQGTQAEMIKLAMVSLDKRIKDEREKTKEGLVNDDIAMILQVHDELVFEVKEDAVSKWQEIVVEDMKNALPLSVPIEVGVAVGKSWGEMEK